MDGPAEYLTLGSFRADEWTVKRSRFIGWGASAEAEDEALDLIEDIRSRHPQATHHCYAYRTGLGAETIRFSDDGEPTGTAGRPILEVLQRARLQNALVVVTRYYGGTPLGAAGLVRAYARSAKLALDAARVVRRVLHARLQCQVDYQSFGRIQHALQERDIHIEQATYGEHVALQILVQVDSAEAVLDLLSELSNGRATARRLGKLYRPLHV